jgi:hypothetical protein
MDLADHASARRVELAAGEDLDPIADLESLPVDFLPERALHAQAQLAVMEDEIVAVGAIAAKDARAGNRVAGRGNIFRMDPLVAVLGPPRVEAVFGFGLEIR